MRVRAKLLVLFVLMAALDAGGKFVERDQPTLDRVQRVALRLGVRARVGARRSANNFEIFRGSSHHLIGDTDLYANYPGEHRDRFKYSPAFAFLFIPLAYAPWGLALLLWQLANALALFYALTRLLKDRRADLAIAIVVLEVWRSMQNIQSNALVAASIIARRLVDRVGRVGQSLSRRRRHVRASGAGPLARRHDRGRRALHGPGAASAGHAAGDAAGAVSLVAVHRAG